MMPSQTPTLSLADYEILSVLPFLVYLTKRLTVSYSKEYENPTVSDGLGRA